MNKTQINYVRERLNIIARKQRERIKKELEPEIKNLTWEEQIGMLLRGEAKLKVDRLTKSLESKSCPYRFEYLFEFFDFPGEIERETAQEKYERKVKAAFNLVSKAQQEYLDKIVLDGKSDARMLKAFNERNFIKNKETK